MSVNKIIFDGETLIDLTEDTVTSDTLLSGVTAHDAAGNEISGTYTGVQTYEGSFTTDSGGSATISLNEIGFKPDLVTIIPDGFLDGTEYCLNTAIDYTIQPDYQQLITFISPNNKYYIQVLSELSDSMIDLICIAVSGSSYYAADGITLAYKAIKYT